MMMSVPTTIQKRDRPEPDLPAGMGEGVIGPSARMDMLAMGSGRLRLRRPWMFVGPAFSETAGLAAVVEMEPWR
jgi:hypothetical protein